MATRLFSFDLRDDGSARFLLNFKRVDGSGIQRISCDLDPAARLEIVLFAEALALRQSLDARVAAEVEAGGLMLAYEPGQPDLRVERQAGYFRQEAQLPLRVFEVEIAHLTEACLADALASKHGPLLRELLRDTTLPEGRAQGATPDKAEQILHQLREIALLLLAREAGTKGSALAAKLRRKGLREEAARMVQGLMDQLAAEMIPEQL